VGVRQVFGFPGDGINGLLAAWGRAVEVPECDVDRGERLPVQPAAAHVAAVPAHRVGERGDVDGVAAPHHAGELGVDDGALEVPAAPGHGMTLREEAERWRVA
jgi:hypothetical protein